MDEVLAKVMGEDFAKPKLKRSSSIAIPETPKELEVSVKQVSGGRLHGTFIYDDAKHKNAVAYDIAGNPVECSVEEIVANGLRPSREN